MLYFLAIIIGFVVSFIIGYYLPPLMINLQFKIMYKAVSYENKLLRDANRRLEKQIKEM